MQGVAKGVGKLSGKAKRRAEAALARIAKVPEPLDEPEARRRFAEAFEVQAA
jgi:beta-N-acetylhexosaminidase